MDGLGLCPYDPRHNSTAVFAGKFLRVYNFALEIGRSQTRAVYAADCAEPIESARLKTAGIIRGMR